jgi:hypothetical protein
MSWPGLRTAVTLERAIELLQQHGRRPSWRWRHPVRSWQMRRLCVACLEPRPCRQHRWALEMLEEIGKQWEVGPPVVTSRTV